MIPALILAATLPTQIRQCQTAASFCQSYAVQASYTVPAYTQTYATTAYATYAQPYTEVKFAPVIYDNYYSALVGGAARAANKREQDLLGRADLAARVDKLSASIDRLAAGLVQGGTPPPVAPTPVAPAKPTPDTPTR